jgi:hypothetical protein
MKNYGMRPMRKIISTSVQTSPRTATFRASSWSITASVAASI